MPLALQLPADVLESCFKDGEDPIRELHEVLSVYYPVRFKPAPGQGKFRSLAASGPLRDRWMRWADHRQHSTGLSIVFPAFRQVVACPGCCQQTPRSLVSPPSYDPGRLGIPRMHRHPGTSFLHDRPRVAAAANCRADEGASGERSVPRPDGAASVQGASGAVVHGEAQPAGGHSGLAPADGGVR